MPQKVPSSAPASSETAHDLCAGLRCTTTTLRRMELDGRIPAPVRIGRRKLWPAGTVAKLLLGTQAGGAKMAEHGISAEDLGAAKRKSATSKPIKPPKYQGPNGELWAGGAGRKPGWVKAAIAAGELDNYLIA